MGSARRIAAGASAAVQAVVKSGTNNFHGNAFEFLRDKSLNAMNKFEQLNHDTLGTPKPEFRRNQYGATFGGPIVMNRAHFLVAADLTETKQAITVNTGKPQFYRSVEGTFPNPSLIPSMKYGSACTPPFAMVWPPAAMSNALSSFAPVEKLAYGCTV